ncbi:MAG: hypothetical protein KKD05_03215 [Candidatus Omnitrophica bacterium]|nr:hypothetical protein [Candidatus Omnitrophota bacterium]
MGNKQKCFFIFICLILMSSSTGCSTRTLVLRGSRENLIKNIKVNKLKSDTRKNVKIKITKWGPEYRIQTGYHGTEYHSLQAAIASGGSGGEFSYESTWKESKALAAAMKKIGYESVDVASEYQVEGKHGRPYRYDDIEPEYTVNGTYPPSLGPNMIPKIIWDVIMAVPSLVLPVPVMGSYTWTYDINISDGKTNKLLSNIKKKLDYRLTGFSLWGIIGAVGPTETMLSDIAVNIIDEEIMRLESEKEILAEK